MTGLVITLLLALGVSGTVQRADIARPGDTFFPIDQKVEEMRMSLSSGASEDALRIKFAEERIAEIENLMWGIQTAAEMPETDKAKVREGIEAALDLLSGLHMEAGTNPEVLSMTEKLNSYLASLSETPMEPAE